MFQQGQQVTWYRESRGGYGYVTPVKAEVVRCTAKRVLINVEQLRPIRQFVEKWVNG